MSDFTQRQLQLLSFSAGSIRWNDFEDRRALMLLEERGLVEVGGESLSPPHEWPVDVIDQHIEGTLDTSEWERRRWFKVSEAGRAAHDAAMGAT